MCQEGNWDWERDWYWGLEVPRDAEPHLEDVWEHERESLETAYESLSDLERLELDEPPEDKGDWWFRAKLLKALGEHLLALTGEWSRTGRKTGAHLWLEDQAAKHIEEPWHDDGGTQKSLWAESATLEVVDELEQEQHPEDRSSRNVEQLHLATLEKWDGPHP